MIRTLMSTHVDTSSHPFMCTCPYYIDVYMQYVPAFLNAFIHMHMHNMNMYDTLCICMNVYDMIMYDTCKTSYHNNL